MSRKSGYRFSVKDMRKIGKFFRYAEMPMRHPRGRLDAAERGVI
jgi:hypothetical protein